MQKTRAPTEDQTCFKTSRMRITSFGKRGHVDAYHAGFPCGTFSRLRFRAAQGLPGPVRTKLEPYGKAARRGTPAQQEECDRGTVLASRAINMATEVANRKRHGKIQSIATLENPPPSNVEGHLSAWELTRSSPTQRYPRSTQHVLL